MYICMYRVLYVQDFFYNTILSSRHAGFYTLCNFGWRGLLLVWRNSSLQHKKRGKSPKSQSPNWPRLEQKPTTEKKKKCGKELGAIKPPPPSRPRYRLNGPNAMHNASHVQLTISIGSDIAIPVSLWIFFMQLDILGASLKKAMSWPCSLTLTSFFYFDLLF